MKLIKPLQRTLIFDMDIYEVSHGRKRLQHQMNASELLEESDLYNQLDFNVSEEWVQIPVTEIKHVLVVSSPYNVQMKIGEEGSVMDINKFFAMQGKITDKVFLKSNYEVDNVVTPVRCTVQVS